MTVAEKTIAAYLPIKPSSGREEAKALYVARLAARIAAKHAVHMEKHAPLNGRAKHHPSQPQSQQQQQKQQTQKQAEAKPAEQAAPATTQLFGSFLLDQEEYALPAINIREVFNFPERIIPVPLSPAYLEGIFTLRGTVIPVVNLRRLFDPEAPAADPSQKIAIIDHEHIQVGMLFDCTGEIMRVRPEQRSTLKYEGKNAQGVICGTVQLNDGARLLQVLDPFALLHIENIPQVLERRTAGRKVESDRFHLQAERRQCVSFHVGASAFAFEMVAIREIIRVPELKSSVLNSKLCVGAFHFRGGMVPVVDFSALLKSGEPGRAATPEQRLVIARIGTVSVGFLVDSVDDIVKFFPDDVLPIPLLSKTRAGMYRGCILRANAGEIILLDHEKIFSSNEIVEINRGHANLFKDQGGDQQEQVLKRTRRQVYLAFRLDNVFAVEIKQIREIIEFSDNLMKPPGMPAFMLGILNLRQQMISIVDMRSLYAMPALPDRSTAKVLIVEHGDERYGFVVDSVENIITVADSDRYPVPKMMRNGAPAGLRSEMDEVIDLPGENNTRQTFSVFQCEVFLARLTREMEQA